jgi:SAM-dependent methyltransferase
MKKLINDHHIYDGVSSIYDGLMDEVNYLNWANYVTDVIEMFTKSSGPILELASGTCRLASILSNKFNNIVVSDISLWMLKKSNDKNLEKICCDMTFLPLKSKFPIIISTFDSVNYLLSEKKLIKLFNEIKNILTDDGIFSFDASLYNNSLDHIKDYVSSGDVDGVFYKRNSKFNKRARIHKNIFEIIDNSRRPVKEIHKQKIYDFHTYFDLVYEAGLKVVECYEAFSFKAGNSESARVQFIVKKQS